MRRFTFFTLMAATLLALITACSALPDKAAPVKQDAPLFPDYTAITFPVNMAPLNFMIDGAKRIHITIKGTQTYTFGSRSQTMRFPQRAWKKMLAQNAGCTLDVTVAALVDGHAVQYTPFSWTVASEPIDTYMSYRCIEPAYEVWNLLTIRERDVTSFKERILADNNITENACINCHTSNRAPNPTTFMHVRGKKGGTVYQKDGRMLKFNTSTPSTSGSAVYGELTQDGRYGIFTTATILPILHAYRTDRLEVYDTASDLILLDFEKGTVRDTPAVTGTDFQETFPCFSADNKTIYFCRAVSLPQPDSTRFMQYDLYSMAFDPETGALGDSLHLVLDLASQHKSASFPKCSPDGRYLLFSVSDYGTFPIWHPETDLWMLDLQTGHVDTLPQTNGRYSDSYHSWSSNSRWFVFASKRGDRVFGRPYIAYVAPDGTVGKAFVLPQRHPSRYLTFTQSYNIPEVYPQREVYHARDIRRMYRQAPTQFMEYVK